MMPERRSGLKDRCSGMMVKAVRQMKMRAFVNLQKIEWKMRLFPKKVVPLYANTIL